MLSTWEPDGHTPVDPAGDLIGRWASEVAAIDERAGRPYGDAALRAALRAKRSVVSRPGLAIDGAAADGLLRRVVGGVARDRGPEVVSDAAVALRDDETMWHGRSSEPVWDEIAGTAQEIALASSGIIGDDASSLRTEIAERYARAAVPDEGCGGTVSAVVALGALARDPEFHAALAVAGHAMLDRFRDQPPIGHPHALNGALHDAKRLAAALRVDGDADLSAVADRAQEEALMIAKAAVEGFVAGVPASVDALLNVGFVDAAERLAQDADGPEGERLRAAVDHAAAIMRGEEGSAVDAARWVDDTRMDDPSDFGHRIVETALARSPHRAAHISALPEPDRTDAAAGAEWSIEELLGTDTEPDALEGGPEQALDGAPGAEMEGLDREHGSARLVDDLPDHFADLGMSPEQPTEDLGGPDSGEPDLGI